MACKPCTVHASAAPASTPFHSCRSGPYSAKIGTISSPLDICCVRRECNSRLVPVDTYGSREPTSETLFCDETGSKLLRERESYGAVLLFEVSGYLLVFGIL
jgi:hypothetical protein